MSRKFLIKLNHVHEQSGKTKYQVAKESGAAYNTVKRYADGWVETDKLSPEVALLAAYYGVDWRDPQIVEVIEGSDEEDTKQFSPAIGVA